MRFVIVVALSLVAICATAAPAIAGKGGKKEKPDLVVKEGALTGQPYGFSEEENTISFRDLTKNVGKKKAGESVTQLLMIRPGGVTRQIGTRAIAKLKDGKSSNGSSETTYTLEPPLGAHTLRVCADAKNDVKEKNENNNCLAVPGHYFVIERIWSGSVSGTACISPSEQGCGPITETFQSDNATFTFNQYLGDGVFNYAYRGVVFYLDQGYDGEDCTWSSGDGANASPGGAGSLVLDYLMNRYNAAAFAPAFYTISVECDEQDDEEFPGPWNEYFLQTSQVSGAPSEFEGQPLPFGHAFVQGSYTGAEIGGLDPASITWTWNLQ